MRILNIMLMLNTLLVTVSMAIADSDMKPVSEMDEADRQILEAYLGHAESSARYCTPERMAKFASQPEDITWQASKYIEMPLIAYHFTNDEKYLGMFVERMDTLCDQLKKGPDGFLGWYGLALDLFRHPDHPEQPVDVILTSFVIAGMMADFACVVQKNASLAGKYGDAAKRYMTLAEDHLIKKWHERGRYKDLGEKGAVYITNADLKPTKASLTQPHNKHSKMMRGLLSLYAATGKDEYLIKAVKLGTRFKNCLTLVDGHYEWNYWDPAGDWDIDPENPSKWKHWIGAEHRSGYYSSTLSQAVLIYEYGLVFDKTDMDRFVRTQMSVCWNGDMDNPVWARVDGKEADGAYLCSSLSPFEPRVYEMAYGKRAQQERFQNKDHGWQGGPVTSGWLEFKYLVYPRWKDGNPAEKSIVEKFVSQKKNQEFLAGLALQVEGSGYKAPLTPDQMR